MSKPVRSKSKLHSLLNKSITESPSKNLSQDSSNAYRSKQYEELQRLKSICFPKNSKDHSLNRSNSVSNSIRYERTMSYIPSRDRDFSIDHSHQRNSSFFMESNSLLPPTNPRKKNTTNLSFNLSPVNKSQDSLTEMDFDSFDKISKSRSRSPNRSRSYSRSRSTTPTRINQSTNITAQLKSFKKERRNLDNSLVLSADKKMSSKDTFSGCVEYYIEDISEFVQTLISSLKEVCLTKMSEKSLNLIVKKYTLKLDQLREQWVEQSKSNMTASTQYLFFFRWK